MREAPDRHLPGPSARWVVLKFGGTSVASLERWRTIAELVRLRLDEGLRPLLVCSALAGVSNALEDLLARARAGRDTAQGLRELGERHLVLADELGLDGVKEVGDLLAELERELRGVHLTREASPRLRARVLARGEALSTRLGCAWLNAQGLRTSWLDARDLLAARRERGRVAAERQYLSATCSHEADPALAERLAEHESVALLTQGFIARAPGGGPALLGRGGSDTSAAYLAARLGAERLEIWTDVPGLFSADPRQVSGARLLLELGYAEAAELANRGAKVLHPRCLEPVARHGIPVHVRCTPAPELPGTVISPDGEARDPGVKAVLARRAMTLISMDVVGSWQRVGLVADLAGRFKAHDLSIDALASSPTNLTVALDAAANHLNDAALRALLDDLRPLCEPSVIAPAASVSVVGTSLRAILHELAPVLERLGPERVYLVSQAADDMSLTFLVDEGAAERIVADLHEELVATDGGGGFGPTWEELAARRAPRESGAS